MFFLFGYLIDIKHELKFNKIKKFQYYKIRMLAMISEIVGLKLKELRQQRQLTLQEVSQLTDVSTASLHNIENNSSSPSIDTLWKISSGLAVPINYFFTVHELDFEIARPHDFQKIPTEDMGVTIKSIFNSLSQETVELFDITLNQHMHRKSAAHLPGTIEIVIVTEGTLTMVINEQIFSVQAGELGKFSGAFKHEYKNQTNQRTKFICLMIYLR